MWPSGWASGTDGSAGAGGASQRAAKPSRVGRWSATRLEALIGAVFLTFGFEQTRMAVAEAFDEQMQRGAAGNVDSKDHSAGVARTPGAAAGVSIGVRERSGARARVLLRGLCGRERARVVAPGLPSR